MRLTYLLAICLVFTACAVQDDGELPFDGEAEDGGKADEVTVALTPINVDISSSRLSRGGTYVLTSRNAWYRIMGTASPSSIDFSKEWVVFYGMGVRNTGGYSAEVTGLRYSAGGRSLTVSTKGTSPGANCIVTQALTSPHFVAKFTIPAPRPHYALADHSDAVRDCTSASRLVEYRYGNQISASDLVIMSDGAFDHEERHTPTDIQSVAHPQLDAAKLAQLDAWIAAAATGTLVRSDGGATNLGSSSGYLNGYLADGTKVVIVTDARDTDGDGYNDVTVNQAAEAAQLRGMIVDLVERDLP